MFSGAQFSLYPMSDRFVDIILDAISALEPWKDRLRVETDDLSTLIVGNPEVLFPGLRDVFVRAAGSGAHCVLSTAVSRGCPGEPEDPICIPTAGVLSDAPLAERVAAARKNVGAAPATGVPVAAQFSLYPLGSGQHMDEIYGCIEFLKAAGIFDGSKHFCTKLRGDAGPVFAGLSQAFTSFGAPGGHVALDVTVSANSPSVR